MTSYFKIDEIPIEIIDSHLIIQASEEPRKFYCFPSVEDLESYIQDHSGPSLSFRETGIVTKNGRRAIKPFLDFEWYPEKPTSVDSRSIFHSFLMPRLIQYLHHTYGLNNLAKKDFLFFPMDRKDKTKLSFHAILDRQIYFRSMKDHRNFMRGFKLFIQELPSNEHFVKFYTNCLDNSVYNREDTVHEGDKIERRLYFSLRLPLCSKEGRMKEIPEDASFSDCFVLKYNQVSKMNEQDDFFLDKILDHTTAPSILSVSHPENKNGKIASMWIPTNKEEALKIASAILPFDKSTLEIDDFNPSKKMIIFKRKDKSRKINCLICKKEHNNFLPFAYFSGNSLKINCFSNTNRRRNKAKLIFPLTLSVSQQPVNENKFLHLRGKVIDYKNNTITLKTPDNIKNIKIKGAATVEMICPLFQWDVTVILEHSSTDEGVEVIYQLHKVNDVKLLALRKGGEWDCDSWKHLSHIAVRNLFSDYRLSAESAIEYCLKIPENATVQSFIDNCRDFSLRNIWLTRAQLLRLINDFPDSYRVGQCEYVSLKNVYQTLLFLRCSELFNNQTNLAWLMDNISITHEFREYVKNTPDYEEAVHGNTLKLCELYQSMLATLIENQNGDKIVSLVMDREEAAALGKLIEKFDLKMLACTLLWEHAQKLGHPKAKEDQQVVIFYLKQNAILFKSLMKLLSHSTTMFNLVNDSSIEEHCTPEQLFFYDQEENKYLFPKTFSRPVTINDTIKFVNDVALKTNATRIAIRCNFEHCWNHLRGICEYNKARQTGTLESWCNEQVAIGNVLDHPVWNGSLFWLLCLSQ